MFPKISSMDSAEKNKWLTIVRAFYGQVGGIINEEDEEAFVESDINHIMANNQLLIREIIIDSRPGFDETTDLSAELYNPQEWLDRNYGEDEDDDDELSMVNQDGEPYEALLFHKVLNASDDPPQSRPNFDRRNRLRDYSGTIGRDEMV